LLVAQLTGAVAMAQSLPSSSLPAASEASAPETEALPAPHALTLEEALTLGEKNNRDLLAARARLRGAHADVERALAALLPTVTAQGKFTYNYPEVTFDLGQILGAGGSMVASTRLINDSAASGALLPTGALMPSVAVSFFPSVFVSADRPSSTVSPTFS
jgi:outer membrane protein TolC